MIYTLTWYRDNDTKGNSLTVDEDTDVDGTNTLENVLTQWFGFGHIASIEVVGEFNTTRVYKNKWDINSVHRQLTPVLSIKEKSELEI